jgi:septum formation protein
MLILASGSPRRRQLLACLDLPFRVVVPDVDEDVPSAASLPPEQMAETLASAKALSVAQREGEGLVLAADTLVVDSETVLGKPRDAAEAAAMLRRLRDREHRVITGLALVDAGRPNLSLVEHVTTAVRMRSYGEEEIAAYIARGEPFDKAGAYAIQDDAFHPVASYDGCYCNVVGLPLRAVVRLLRKGRVDITDEHMARLPRECEACPAVVEGPARQ